LLFHCLLGERGGQGACCIEGADRFSPVR